MAVASYLSRFFVLGNICKSHRCVICCYDTEMLLLDSDVKRIRALGYNEEYFSRLDPDGFKVLRNSSEGRCVFHDGSQCTIYENRPKGCKLYPIIFDENSMSAVRDKVCPYRSEFSLSQKEKKEVWNVYPRLIAESSKRDRAKAGK